MDCLTTRPAQDRALISRLREAAAAAPAGAEHLTKISLELADALTEASRRDRASRTALVTLLPAARATLAAAEQGETDPLSHLWRALKHLGQLPARGDTARHILATTTGLHWTWA